MHIIKQLLALFIIVNLFSCDQQQSSKTIESKNEEGSIEKLYPYEDYYLDKQYPETQFHYKVYLNALKEVKSFIGQSANRSLGQWKVQGPGNIGARINTIAVHPSNENIIFVGYSEGGAFRTKNGGISWEPIFDEQLKLTIGDIVFDPQNPNTIYIGTGDPNISGFPFIGNGLFRSDDGGDSWINIGLAETSIISQIRIPTSNPNIIYVAGMGLPFVKNQHKGIYKSEDKGNTWNQILFVNDSTSISDLALHPTNPNILYATGWNRIRNNKKSVVAGPDAKIYKTIDGGLTWVILKGGLPEESQSRLGIDICLTNPNILYACYTKANNLQLEGIYKSEDGGTTWLSLPVFDGGIPEGMYGGFGWYFGKIRVNPNNPNDVFILGVDMYRSLDGGYTWQMAVPPWWTYEVHADKHDLVFTTNDILLATDGGLYKTPISNTEVWEDIENIPTTQFYRVAYNPTKPDQYYGGAQDNGTTGGNRPNINNWERIYGGDGFQPVFHPIDSNIFYVETQNGGIVYTIDGGNTFRSGREGLDPNEPRNWDMPYIMSHHNPDVLYTGTNRLYRSSNGPVPLWEPISDVLTDLNSDFLRKNISSLHESPIDPNILYVATTDGYVWNTTNGGTEWNLAIDGLPKRYMTSIVASPTDSNTVYVTMSGYRDNDNTPHIFKSVNNGLTWNNIQGDLPYISINKVLVLPGYNDRVIFVGTDGGVFYTKDGGRKWMIVGDNMPIIAVYDLCVNIANNQLVAGTHGRSIQSFDLDQLDFTSSTKNEQLSTFGIYPTLVTDQIWIDTQIFKNMNTKYVIVNNTGGIVANGVVPSGKSFNLSLSHLTAGQYYISIYANEGIQTKKFIKI